MQLKKQKISKEIVITGLLCITLIELYALSKGINGTLLCTVIGIIALTIGVGIPSNIIKK